MERDPEFRTFVGSWTEEQHRKTLSDPDSFYLVAEDEDGRLLGVAILLGFQSEHNSIELKRILVSVPNQGVGRRLLEVAAHKVFTEHHAHRFWLDVFSTNDRACHVYKTFGFREEGQLREAVRRDGSYYSLILMSLLEGEYRAGSHSSSANEISP
jgi:diamine N-acetyltransferase